VSQHGKYRFASQQYTLSYSPRTRKVQAQVSGYERLITILASMVALWDALAVPIAVLTLALWLLALLIMRTGLVTLFYNWKVLLLLS
jgi:hypothetical protein